MTDAASRNQAIAALRRVRQAYRKADTAGEKVERELDRLIKRKTRMSTSSLVTLNSRFNEYQTAVEACQAPLADSYVIIALV